MPPAPRRTAFGYRRRLPYHLATPNGRKGKHLSCLEVDFRHSLQQCILAHVDAVHRSAGNIRQLVLLQAAVRCKRSRRRRSLVLQKRVDYLLQTEAATYRCHVEYLAHWIYVDHEHHDMSPLEETSLPLTPRRDVRIGDWDEDHCSEWTGFTRYQLVRIYRLFDLRGICEAEQTDAIGVETGFSNRDGSPTRYNFHPEELFLFFMTKNWTGDTNRELVNDKFGGYCNRWSYAYPWMVFHLDDRYRDIIGHQHLLKYLKEFPRFHRAIEQFVQKRKPHCSHDGPDWVSPGIRRLPWFLFGLIDCNILRGDVMHSGPDGYYVGAPRREDREICDRATYTGFTQVHGVKGEVVGLPNGIMTVFGACSCRRNDTGGMLRMSGLDDFLGAIQENEPIKYNLFGDLAYRAFWLNNIVTYFRAFAGEGLTRYEKVVNAEMKSVRQRVEFPFAAKKNMLKICTKPDSFRLGKNCPYAVEQYRIVHLLLNIHTCLNGNHSTSYECFNISPPVLEEYLRLN